MVQVIEAHVTPETYEAKLEAAGVPSEKPEVKQFLDNMTYDRSVALPLSLSQVWSYSPVQLVAALAGAAGGSIQVEAKTNNVFF